MNMGNRGSGGAEPPRMNRGGLGGGAPQDEPCDPEAEPPSTILSVSNLQEGRQLSGLPKKIRRKARHAAKGWCSRTYCC